MFNSIFYNGDEYNQMWLNGNKIWEKDNGGSGEEIVYPYDDADSVITYMNTSSSAQSQTFTVIDSSLPYSINGTSTTSFSFPASSETQVKLVNLKPTALTTLFPVKIEQLRLPNLTDLSSLFRYFGYNADYEYSWSPQYFEFNENPTNMSYMFSYCRYLTDEMMDEFMPHLESFNYSNVASIKQMFAYCSTLTRLDLSNILMYMPKATDENAFIFVYMSSLETAKIPMLWMPSSNQQSMFQSCTSLKEADIMNIDTSYNTYNYYEFYLVNGATVYVGENWTLGTSSTTGNGTNNTFVTKVVPIEFIGTLTCSVKANNVTEQCFTIKPNIIPAIYSYSDLEVVYDSTYMDANGLFDFALKDGSQGKSFDITYRSKSDNSISRTITITVSEDLDFGLGLDYVPSEMQLHFTDTYGFNHGEFTTNVYGLIPSNKGTSSSTAYTRYKYVAPTSGSLKFTYRCSSESGYDYLAVHVNTSTTQPAYNNTTDRVIGASGTTYASKDGTATKSVTGGTTYYIHVQYRKDGSGNSGYDMGCIRKIELV